MPEFNLEDTIAAIATPVGEGGIAVIRLSGPEAESIVAMIFDSPKGNLRDFPSHTIHLGEIRDRSGVLIDQVLLSVFRAPSSYTGQEVFEISSHGGLVVTKRILDLLIQNGARHAEPGEFTKRAFLNGKIDLTQAEAILDLIKARSDKSLQTAVRQLAGTLSQKFKSLKEDMMLLLAHLEAYLDFPDEHLEIYEDKDLLQKIAALEKEMETLIQGFRRGAILREGALAVLVGKPNVGKSSLFNALLARDRALVSEFPGTTRDSLEEAIELNGVYIRLVDTAGLHLTSPHPLDQLSMERTRQALSHADLFLYIVDGSQPLENADKEVFKEINREKPVLVLINKSDLPPRLAREEVERFTGINSFIKISSKTREGFEELEKNMAETIFSDHFGKEGEQVTRLRHKNALEKALQHLKESAEALREKKSLEFVASDLKSALDALRELIGEVYSEDLLDVIFAEFCIGK